MIFYEKEKAEEILKSGFTSFMNFNDLLLLAKYFKYIGKNKIQIENSLISFCKKYNSDFNEILSRKKINNAISASEKYSIRLPINVNVTTSELENIKKCGNHNRQKVLFSMLVIAKYFKYNNTRLLEKKIDKFDDLFYVNETITNILKIAKVNVSKKERLQIQYDLQQLGFITSIGSKSFQIHFVDENSKISIVVNDMDNLIDFYPFYCSKCGKKFEERSKKHDLCKDCYNDNRKEVKRESIRRIRNKNE